MNDRVDRDLQGRWTSEEGEWQWERLLFCWRSGRAWRDVPLWCGGSGDARPDLRGIDLTGERLVGVDLSDTRLDEAELDEADISGIRLCRSSLRGASFSRTVAVGLDAFAADMVGARFRESTFNRATLVAANLASTSWHRVSLQGADLRGATFHGAELLGCRFEEARLAGVDLEGALVVGARGLPPGRHERDEMDVRSPLFAPLLRLYPRLLHELSPLSQKVAEGCLLASPRPEAEVQDLLLDDNWRVVVAGVAAAFAVAPKRRPRVCEALWIALERGSWAAPQLAGAASLLDREFAARAAVFLAEKDAPRPEKSLVSVASLVDPAGLPARLADLPEAESIRKVTLRWTERTRRATGHLSAKDIGEIMVANLKANQADPDFFIRREQEMSAIARRVMARRGPIDRTLAFGRHGQVSRRGKTGAEVITKEARHPLPHTTPKDPFVECQALFAAGRVVLGDGDLNEVVRCEAEALAALAPATPRPVESGVRSEGRAYLVRPYVPGETWRAALRRGHPVGIESLRRLVEMLSEIEESTTLGLHGDVKPDNVISTWAGEVVLIDPTSAYLRRGPSGAPERLLLTCEYNPLLVPSDHAALALTLIEMLTGHQLVAEAVEEQARPIGPRLRESLRFAASVGADLLARRLPAIRLPSELSPALTGAAETLLLRALGLSFSDGRLEVGEPLGRIRELAAVLEGQ